MILALLLLPLSLPASPSLESGLSAVSAAGICADVAFLASDELEGRDTPSRGQQVAARFLRARLERTGWSPGAGDGYLQPFPVLHVAVDGERSRLVVQPAAGGAERALAFGEDYLLLPWEAFDGELEGPVVFCGRASREELEAADVAGKLVLCIDSDVSASSRRNNVRRAGARGIFVVPDPAKGELEQEARARRQSDQARRGRVVYGEEPAEGAGFAAFHQAFLTASGARALWEAAGVADPAAAPPAVGTVLPLRLREERRLPGDRGLVQVENVCGFLPGNDPALKDEVVLISAHYDHEGVIAGEVYNGADDNASGTSALLALVDALPRLELRRSVMLVWVAGEEKGLYGSRAWVASPTLPEGSRAVCDINLDMVGRNEPGELYLTPTRRHPAHTGLSTLAERLAADEGFAPLGSADPYYERSDHYVFAELGIPVLFLFNGEHADYHRPTDDVEKIDCDKIRRVARLVLRMVDELQGDVLDL